MMSHLSPPLPAHAVRRLIVLGPPLAGKSTLVDYLRATSALPVVELDEELVRANAGVWPSDDDQRAQLVGQIVRSVLRSREVIFFSTYVDESVLRRARRDGFRVVQLALPQRLLLERNAARMRAIDQPSAERYVRENLRFQAHLHQQGLVDCVLDASRPTAALAKEISTLSRGTLSSSASHASA